MLADSLQHEVGRRDIHCDTSPADLSDMCSDCSTSMGRTKRPERCCRSARISRISWSGRQSGASHLHVLRNSVDYSVSRRVGVTKPQRTDVTCDLPAGKIDVASLGSLIN